MTPVNYIQSFPLEVNRLGITSAYELQILRLSASLGDGLRLSNNQLAELFHTDRRTIINSVNRLRAKNYILDKGTKFSRVLVANSEILSLFNSEEVSPVHSEKVSQNSEKVSQNSEKPYTHNIKSKDIYIFVLKDNSTWPLPDDKFSEYSTSFPGIDLHRELRKARQWLLDNPDKRKTAKGMPRFLTGWLGRVNPGKGTTSAETGGQYIEDIDAIEQIYKEAGLC